jgi:hypothetical protein
MGNQKYLLQRQADTKGQPTGRDKIKIFAQSSDFFFLFPPLILDRIHRMRNRKFAQGHEREQETKQRTNYSKRHF